MDLIDDRIISSYCRFFGHSIVWIKTELYGIFNGLTDPELRNEIRRYKNLMKCRVDYNVWPHLHDFQEKYDLRTQKRLQKPYDIVKGKWICRKKLGKRDCGGDEFRVWSEQTRSSDEGMTAFRECIKCGARRK